MRSYLSIFLLLDSKFTHTVNVSYSCIGAANLDVLQVVEYVKQEAKMVYLLECLQKTPPPVIIFSENKNEVDGKLVFSRWEGVLAILMMWGVLL